MDRQRHQTRHRYLKCVTGLGWLFALLLLAASSQSLPRLSSQWATDCRTCHINPNGSGMRNEYGNHAVAFNELVLPQTKKLVKKLYKEPRLSDNVTYGFDLRYLVFDNGRIFRMQTNFYLNLTPFRGLEYQIRFWEEGIQAHYVMLSLDEHKHYVRLGRFYPSFGLRTADHKGFHRERTGHPSLLYLDGIGIGTQIKGLNANVEYFNPEQQSVWGVHVFKTGRIDRFGYLAGASLRLSERIKGSNGRFPHAKAVFGSMSYDRYQLQGELDLVGRGNDTLIAYGNLTARLEYGLYAIAEYNFFDGNRRLKNGAEEFWRLSLEIFPLPYVELRPSYTYYTRGLLVNEDDFFVQLHIGY